MNDRLTFILSIFSLLFLMSCGSNLTAKEAESIKKAGIEKSKKGEHVEAVILLERASRYDVKDAQVYWHLAESYEKVGKMGKALETWQKLLFVLDPKSQEAKEAHERFLRVKNHEKNQ